MKNYNDLQCTNPVKLYPTLSRYLGMSLENCIERLSKTYGRQSYSCSLTAFCASKALTINIHLIYPPVHGLADPQNRFPDYYESSLSSNKNPRLITIVWTTASNIVQTNSINYTFNHFCPV